MKVKIIKYEPMKSTRFLCLALMVKYTFKIIDMIDLLFVIRVNYKKKNSYANNYLKKAFCQANCFNFFSSQDIFFVKYFFLVRTALLSTILNLETAKNLKKS